MSSMSFLVLLFLWGVVVNRTYGEVTSMANCCPHGWMLVKISRGIFRSAKFDCMPPTFDIVGDNMQKIGIFSSLIVYGSELPDNESRNTNIPSCDSPQLIFFTGEEDIQLAPQSCTGHIGGVMVAISCQLRADEQLQWLSVLHKCCPAYYVYDAGERKCVRAHNSTSFAGILVDHAVTFVDKRVDCPRDKAVVEYHYNADKLRFDNGQLELRELHKKFSINSYCLEVVRSGPAKSSSELLPHDGSGGGVNFLVRTCDDVSVCQHLACIRRCCTDGEMFTKGNATSYCRRDEADQYFHSSESLQISGNFTKPPVFGILRSLDCLKFRLDPDAYADEAHTINERDGSLYIMTTKKNYTNSQYCVEKIRNATWSEQKLYTFICFDTKVVGNDRIRFKMYPIGLLISCSFYAMTLVVYLAISKLRNLPGQILICLVCSLFSAYLGIALGQLMPTSNDDVCFASGFFIYFCLMAAFAWMNVMCFDIWQTFGSAKKKRGFNENNRRRFILYSLYGWGLPSFLTVTTIALTKSDHLPDAIRPHFGHGRCWFTYDTLASANLVFFSGPVGILFLINFVLFSLTLKYCNRVKREIFRMQSSNIEKPVLKRRFFVDKARFAMNTKLFIVMGITWLLEILSILFYDHKRTFFWVISDSFNVLLGVFVFFIFVFKKRVWQSILLKLGIKSSDQSKGTPNTTYATQSTCAQSVSMMRLNTMDGNAALLHPNMSARRVPTM